MICMKWDQLLMLRLKCCSAEYTANTCYVGSGAPSLRGLRASSDRVGNEFTLGLILAYDPSSGMTLSINQKHKQPVPQTYVE